VLDAAVWAARRRAGRVAVVGTSLGRALSEEQRTSLLARSALLVALSRVPGPAAMAEAHVQLRRAWPQRTHASSASRASGLPVGKLGAAMTRGPRAASATRKGQGSGHTPQQWPPRAWRSSVWQGCSERWRGQALETLRARWIPLGQALAALGSQKTEGLSNSEQAEGLCPLEQAGVAPWPLALRTELRAACNAVLNAISREGDLRRAIDVLLRWACPRPHHPVGGQPHRQQKAHRHQQRK